jgi:hypothetical protein
VAIAELELALEVGAPQIVGQQRLRQLRPLGLGAMPPAGMGDQTMAVEHRMHRAPRRNADIAVQLAHQELAYLPGAPVRLSFLRRTIIRSTGSGNWLA